MWVKFPKLETQELRIKLESLYEGLDVQKGR